LPPLKMTCYETCPQKTGPPLVPWLGLPSNDIETVLIWFEKGY
jgi:hypothetical protein